MAPTKGETDTKNNQGAGLTGLHNAVLSHLSLTQNADNMVDTKANTIAAASLVLLAVVIDNHHGKWPLLCIVSIILLLMCLFLTLWITYIREYLGAIVDLEAHQEYFYMGDTELLQQLIQDGNYSIGQNTAVLAFKRKWFRWLLSVFVGGVLASALALFLVQA